MDDKPEYTDAAILIALVWGGGPEGVVGATDHLNAGYCSVTDWTHVCDFLGRLGLVLKGDPLPLPTKAGDELVARFLPPNTLPRPAALRLRDYLSTMPMIARPVPSLDAYVLREAVAAHERRFESWRQEEARKALIPNLRGAGILVSLCLGLDSRTDSSASDGERPHPGIADWLHLVQAFGRRGLIENDGNELCDRRSRAPRSSSRLVGNQRVTVTSYVGSSQASPNCRSAFQRPLFRPFYESERYSAAPYGLGSSQTTSEGGVSRTVARSLTSASTECSAAERTPSVRKPRSRANACRGLLWRRWR